MKLIEPVHKKRRAITSENRPILTLPAGVERPSRKLTKEAAFSELGLETAGIHAGLVELGLTKPTLIQSLVIPRVLEKESLNVVFADQTGTGKTLAYLLPVLEALKQDELKYGKFTQLRRPRAIVLVPNRELAEQVLKICKKLSHTVKIRACYMSGSGTVAEQNRLFETPIDLLIATPGRLIQHYKRQRIYFSKVQHVVLDEVDMLMDDSEGGFMEDVMRVIQAVRHRVEATNEPAKFIMCGATLTKMLLDKLDGVFSDSKLLHIISPTLHRSVAKLEQYWYVVSADKLSRLKELLFQEYPREAKVGYIQEEDRRDKQDDFDDMTLEDAWKYKKRSRAEKQQDAKSMTEANGKKIKRTIIFCNTIQSCRFLDHTLREKGFATTSYHGEIPVDQRARNFRQFAEGEVPIIVCTDIASRGLDFVAVDHVILFDFPLNSIDYLHRIGRTARGGQSGKVTNFIMKRDFVLADGIRKAIERGQTLEGLSSSEEENMARRRPSRRPVSY